MYVHILFNYYQAYCLFLFSSILNVSCYLALSPLHDLCNILFIDHD